MAKPMVLQPAEITAVEDATKNAYKAITWVWVFFFVAFAASTYLRYARTNDAVIDLTQLAVEVDNSINKNKSVADTAQLYASEYLEEKDADLEATQLRTLVRGLAYQIKVDNVDVSGESGKARFRDRISTDLFTNLLVLSLIHGAILASFPAFFTMTAFKARDHIRKFTPTGSPKTTGRTEKLADTFWNGIWYRRHVDFLKSESRSYIGRRLGFAILVSLSISYMLAPSGLYSAAIGEYMTLNPVPGRASNPFWFAEFAQASPFVLGLLGFLIYSLLTIVRRGVSFDVSSNLFLSLWNRGITVVILSLVLTAIDEGSTISRALIFVAGVFPQAGLQAIGKLAQTGVDKLADLRPTGLTNLPDIDSIKEGSLRELGIYSVSDLALTDVTWLIVVSRIQPRVLLKAMDRALLLERLGAYDEQLKKIPAFTASDLILYVYGNDAYKSRWKDAGIEQCRELAKNVPKPEQNERLQRVASELAVVDIQVHVRALRDKTNLWFILDNRLAYEDL